MLQFQIGSICAEENNRGGIKCGQQAVRQVAIILQNSLETFAKPIAECTLWRAGKMQFNRQFARLQHGQALLSKPAVNIGRAFGAKCRDQPGLGDARTWIAGK